MWCYLFSSILLLLSFLCITHATKCILRDSYLESLLCVPNIDPNTNCIVRYDCNKTLEREIGVNQCFYGGRVYNSRTRIDIANEYCKFGCYCDRNSRIVCAERECPIYDTPLEPGCYYTSKEHSCCPTDIQCEYYENLYTCEYNGKTYLQGMEFYPHPCTKCICQEGFRGEIVSPYCIRVQCLSDVTYHDSLKHKCAPIYFKDQCCPEKFACPHESDEYRRKVLDYGYQGKSGNALNFRIEQHIDAGNTCQYGHRNLNIGDMVTIKSVAEATCTCITPPVLTCLVTEQVRIVQ